MMCHLYFYDVVIPEVFDPVELLLKWRKKNPHNRIPGKSWKSFEDKTWE